MTTSVAITTIRADNPGPMTLDGTNSYLIAADASGPSVLVDPGPDDDEHLRALAQRDLALVLITHRHADHTAGSARLHEWTSAPVRAVDPDHCHGAAPLTPGMLDVAETAGVRLEVVASPGHTDDSVSLFVPDFEHDFGQNFGQGIGQGIGQDFEQDTAPTTGAMLTGDTILGRGTTVIAHPDGNLADYFGTLDRLESYGNVAVLPAHGDRRSDLAAVCRQYREHRKQRLAQVAAVCDQLGDLSSLDDPRARTAVIDTVVDAVYTDIADGVRAAAAKSVAAQLDYLAEHGCLSARD